jgi:hypothetical protein
MFFVFVRYGLAPLFIVIVQLNLYGIST